MPTPKKPRSDSPLRSLPEERQAEVIGWLKEKPQAEVRSLCRERLGFAPSLAALSGFWSWWHMRQRLAANETVVLSLMEEIKREQPDLSDDQLFAVGQRFFTALAIEQQDSLTWKRAQDSMHRRRQWDLDRRKLELLERRAAQADAAERVTSDASLSPEEKQQRIREVFGLA